MPSPPTPFSLTGPAIRLVCPCRHDSPFDSSPGVAISPIALPLTDTRLSGAPATPLIISLGGAKVIFNLSRAPGEPPHGSQGVCVAFSHQNMTFNGRAESSWHQWHAPRHANTDD